MDGATLWLGAKPSAMSQCGGLAKSFDSSALSSLKEQQKRQVRFVITDDMSRTAAPRLGWRPPSPGSGSADVRFRSELGNCYIDRPGRLVPQYEMPSGSLTSVSACKRPDGSVVVVKRIRLLGISDQGLEILTNEVRLLASMRHRHIVRFHGAFYKAGNLCILFDLAAGGSLEDAIAKQARRVGEQAAELPREGFDTCFVTLWLSQLVTAVLFLHSQGVLHRDISTSNVFLDMDACIVVGDLGVAKRVSDHCLTGTNRSDALATTYCGTPDFMSPELVQGTPYGRASDAWAVGVILFNLLALERPFRPDGIISLARQIVESDITATAQEALLGCGHPPELLHLASREGLLHPDAEKRTTLEQVLDAFPLEEDED